MRVLVLSVFFAIAGCGGDPSVEHVAVKLNLVQGDCADTALQLVGSVDGAAGARAQSCVTLQAEGLASLQLALRDKARFNDLEGGELTVGISGFVNGSCAGPPLFCGRAQASLPVVGDAIDLPLSCWGGVRASDYAACSGGAVSGALALDVTDGGCADVDARRVRAIRVKVGDNAAEACATLGAVSGFSSLETALEAALRFSGLAPGSTQIVVWGFDDDTCRGDKLVACGAVDLLLPEAAPLSLRCAAGVPAGCPTPP